MAGPILRNSASQESTLASCGQTARPGLHTASFFEGILDHIHFSPPLLSRFSRYLIIVTKKFPTVGTISQRIQLGRHLLFTYVKLLNSVSSLAIKSPLSRYVYLCIEVKTVSSSAQKLHRCLILRSRASISTSLLISLHLNRCFTVGCIFRFWVVLPR